MPTALGWNLITLPNDPAAPAAVDFTAYDIVAASLNPFTGQQQFYDWGGAVLEASISMPPLTHVQAQNWIAFLLSLKGTANVFQFGDPLAQAPQAGVVGGTPVVNGAGQTGRTLNTKGWPAPAFGPYPYVLRPGDWLQIGYRLYRNLTSKIISDPGGVGLVTLDIWPPLREPPADGDAIIVTNTLGLWRLKSNQRKWSITESRFYGLQFEIREAL
jgi:hypothetical protein